MSLLRALEQENTELILDNAELSLEEPESILFTDVAVRQKVM